MSESAVRAAFRDQARACAALGSSFTAAVCDRLGQSLQTDQGPVAARVLGWPGDPSVRADSVPLRLCGALHALVLGGDDPALARAYRARVVDEGAILTALRVHADRVLEWLDHAPQTNEVGRSAVLIAAARFLAALCPQPIRALELGASAGLNLNFPRYRLAPGSHPTDPSDAGDAAGRVVLRPDWQGDVPQGGFDVASAEGVDLHPLDPQTDGLRLMAYCWADQERRLARLRAALHLARTHPPRVAAGDAGDWLRDRLARPAPDRLTLVCHTVAHQHFPPATQFACADALRRAADAAAAGGGPVAHFSMEADGGDGAALTLRLWDGRARGWHLGRADFHGRWVSWHPIAIQGLGDGRREG